MRTAARAPSINCLGRAAPGGCSLCPGTQELGASRATKAKKAGKWERTE